MNGIYYKFHHFFLYFIKISLFTNMYIEDGRTVVVLCHVQPYFSYLVTGHRRQTPNVDLLPGILTMGN